MTIRAVAVDIDGTMTDYQRVLDLEGVKAIRAVERKGIPVLAATGNVAPVTKAFCNYVGTTGAAICENGGIVFDNGFRRSKILSHRRHADRAVGHLRRKGFEVRLIATDAWRVSEVALELNLDVNAVKETLKDWNLIVVTSRFAIHLMDPKLDKINGLRHALKFMDGQLAPKDVLAIGDSNNDVNLLRGCGANGTPANCSDAIRDVAAYVARRPHGRGVKEVLEHYGVL